MQTAACRELQKNQSTLDCSLPTEEHEFHCIYCCIGDLCNAYEGGNYLYCQ